MADRPDPVLPPVPWSTRDVLKALLAMSVATLMVGTGTSALFATAGPPTASGATYLVLLWLIALEGGLVLAAWYFGVRRYRLSWAALGFRRLPGSPAFLLIPAALGAALTTTYLYVTAVDSLGWTALIPPPLPTPLATEPSALLLLALISLLLAPVAEETFFRGFVFAGIGKRFGLLWGAVASAGLFGASHVQPGLLIPMTLLGLLLVLVYVKTRSLWGPILVHFGYNALALAVVV